MGKKKVRTGADQQKKLHKNIKKLENRHKKLARRVRRLEKALTSASAQAKAQQGTAPTPRQAGTYPSPMKSGKYKESYAAYRVTRVEEISPTVMRVVAEPAGKARAESQGLVGEYVRIITGKAGEVLPAASMDGSKPKWKQATTSAKYTVRSYQEETGALEVNIVLHEKGAGTSWARTVKPGDLAHFLGPKSGYEISDDYDYYLLAGDETGLPGMARWIESMPYDARGVAFIEVAGDESRQTIDAPEGFELVWVDARVPGALADAVKGWELPDGAIFTWLAGESTSLQPLRSWVRRELGVPKGHGYSKGYWKRK